MTPPTISSVEQRFSLKCLSDILLAVSMFISGDTHYLPLNDLVMLIAFFAISIVLPVKSITSALLLWLSFHISVPVETLRQDWSLAAVGMGVNIGGFDYSESRNTAFHHIEFMR